jgi:hypothetical protein
MLDKELGKDIPQDRRAAFLNDNCDATQELTYTRQLTSEELAECREKLTDASIKLADIAEEKKLAMDAFKEEAKPYEEIRTKQIKNLKHKSEVVTGLCYKFIDEETRMVGFYNKEGDLVDSRPAFADELQRNIFQAARKTGTNN